MQRWGIWPKMLQMALFSLSAHPEPEGRYSGCREGGKKIWAKLNLRRKNGRKKKQKLISIFFTWNRTWGYKQEDKDWFSFSPFLILIVSSSNFTITIEVTTVKGHKRCIFAKWLQEINSSQLTTAPVSFSIYLKFLFQGTQGSLPEKNKM